MTDEMSPAVRKAMEKFKEALAYRRMVEALQKDDEKVSQCEACGELKADCVSTSFHGLDVYACAACRGAEEERDEAANRGDWEYHQRRG